MLSDSDCDRIDSSGSSIRKVQSSHFTMADSGLEATPKSLAKNYAAASWEKKKKSHFQSNRTRFREHISRGQNWRSDKMITMTREITKIILQTESELRQFGTNSQRKEHWARNKIIVFAELLSALDILEIALAKRSVKVLRFDGTMDKLDRDAIRKRFEEEGKKLSKAA